MNFLTYFRRHWIVSVIVLIIIVLAAFYIAGFRPGPGLTITRVGVLTVTDIPDATEVYTDQTSRGTSRGGSLRASLMPGAHTLIVDAPGFEPWSGVVDIEKNVRIAVSPALISKDPHFDTLTGTTSAAAITAISAAKLPTEAVPLVSDCAALYVADNRVLATPAASPECTPPSFLCSDGTCEPTVIVAPVDTIRAVTPFPGHPDTLLIAINDRLYALGMDPRSPQFFIPIYHGNGPLLVGTLADGGAAMLEGAQAYVLKLN